MANSTAVANTDRSVSNASQNRNTDTERYYQNSEGCEDKRANGRDEFFGRKRWSCGHHRGRQVSTPPVKPANVEPTLLLLLATLLLTFFLRCHSTSPPFRSEKSYCALQ